MVQTVRSIWVYTGQKILAFEKPHSLSRIFFSAQVISDPRVQHSMRMSFDDPLFVSYYVLDWPSRYFQAEGEDIFQGDVWMMNPSNISLLVSLTEILR